MDKLAQDGRGNYRRDAGWEPKAGGGCQQHRFYLGRDRAQATIRAGRIERLWDAVEAAWQEAGRPTPRPLWDSLTLAVGLSIGRGDTTLDIRPPADLSEGMGLALWFGRLSARFGSLGITLTLPGESAEACLQGQDEVQEACRGVPALDTARYLGAARETLHAALDAFSGYLAERHGCTPTAKRYQRQVTQLKAQAADLPLASFGAEQIEALVYQWQQRPTSKRSGKPMALDTCRDAVKRLREFLRWLHRSSFHWRTPDGYEQTRLRLRHTPAELAARAAPHGRRTYSRDELAVLWKYASPWERSLMTLALNCGFGAAEIGTLQLAEIHLDSPHGHYKMEGSWVKRLRYKTSVYAEWQLWPETVAAVAWLNRRRGSSPETSLVLNKAGPGPSGHTQGGTRTCSYLGKAWNTLLARVRKDFPQFRLLSFNKLRKTASSFIRRKYGGEVAGLFLAHGRVCTDDLLDRYAERNFRPVFRACRHYRHWLAPVFSAVADPFPLDMKKHNPSVTPSQVARMAEMRAEGKSYKAIGLALGLHRATVRAHLP